MKIGILSSQENNSIGFIKTSGGTEKGIDLPVRGHISECLVNTFDSLLKKTGVKLKDISGLILDAGPGSYTGIRAGLAFAKTMQYVRGVRIDCVSGLEILREVFIDDTGLSGIPFFAVKKAYSGKYYVLSVTDKKKEFFLMEQNELTGFVNKRRPGGKTGICGDFEFDFNAPDMIVVKHELKASDLAGYFSNKLRRPAEPLYLFSNEFCGRKK